MRTRLLRKAQLVLLGVVLTLGPAAASAGAPSIVDLDLNCDWQWCLGAPSEECCTIVAPCWYDCRPKT